MPSRTLVALVLCLALGVNVHTGTAVLLRVPGAQVQQASASRSGLRIVVVSGEDSVNVVQQNTATAPVIEVRDRSDQPVAGAVVRFVVRGGRNARLNTGLQVLEVTSDASGRASVGSLTPTAAGPVRIDVAASFQGQAVSATITQTNVMTASQVAAAVAAGAAGAGGLSATTIAAILAGGLAGGAIGVKAATGTGGSESSGGSGPSGTTTCTFSVSPASHTVGPQGGAFDVNVSVQPPGCGPATWSAASDNFSNFTLSPTSGTGTGVVRVTVSASLFGTARSAVLTIAGRRVTVAQDEAPLITSSFSGRTDLPHNFLGPGPYTAFYAQPPFTLGYGGQVTFQVTFASPPDCSIAFGVCPGARTGSSTPPVNTDLNSCMNGRGITSGASGASTWTAGFDPGTTYTVFLYVQYDANGRTGAQCRAFIGSIPFSGTVVHR